MGQAYALAMLLANVMKGIELYKQTRDNMIAAGDVTAAEGGVKSDDQLIEMFRSDAVAMRDEADALIAKYTKG